jgi:hypothetical protein
MPQLLNNATTDGAGTAIDWYGNPNPGTLQINGTWDGATVTISGSIDDGSNYIAPLNSAYTSNVIVNFDMAVGKIKATVSNAGASTNLNAYISPG